MSAPYATAPEERERLILEYLPKVQWIAAGIHERLPDGVAQEDLVSAGVIGLIQAIDRYDPARNTALWTYAEYKIRGAILDSIRGMDGVAAHKRKHLKRVQEAVSTAEQRCGRAATEDEIASELQVGLDEYHRMLFDLQGITMDSLDAPAGGGESDDASTLARYIADPNAQDPAAALEEKETLARLAAAVEKLPEVEQMVLHLYYAEELTLVEIGTVVGLHYSRVSQLKSQAVLRLRGHMHRRPAPRRK